MHKSGTSAATKIDLGPLFPRQSENRSKMYEVVLFCPPGSPEVRYEFRDLGTGAAVVGEVSTNIPSATQLVKWGIIASTGGVNTFVGISVNIAYSETDY
jgi:hypothetical protein